MSAHEPSQLPGQWKTRWFPQEISLPAGEAGGGIVTGADGAIWFTVYAPSGGRVSRFDSARGLTEFPQSAAIADNIAATPDGDL